MEGTGEDSYLAKVVDMVRQAQETKSRTQALSDRAAFWLTILSITVGVTTLITWLALGQDLQFSIARMATVMIITCPHALGLAIPLVVAVSTTKSAQNGLLIRDRKAFENARKITTVVFDKTGTLTTGRFEVVTIDVHDPDFDRGRVLALAASLEGHSEHPLARGITRHAKDQGAPNLDTSDFRAEKGKGIVGTVDGSNVRVLSPGALAEIGLDRPDDMKDRGGVTRVFVVVDDVLAGSIALADEVRPESAAAIRALQSRGIRTWMLTGDNHATAQAVAEELGLDGFYAEVLPDDKLDRIRELQQRGEYVAMTGDGVNDAPALAQAQIGIAVGSGTDVAAATADIVLVDSNPLDVAGLILFGRATYRKMIQNLVWATAYNLLAIPLAAGVLYGVGFVLSPEVGAILMSLSTVAVAVNARRLDFDRSALEAAA